MPMINTWPGWECVRQIGTGSYGTVYEIKRTDFGMEWRSALKVITIPKNESELRAVSNEGMSRDEVAAYFKGIVDSISEEFRLMHSLAGLTNVVSCEDYMTIPHDDGITQDILIRMELLTPLTDFNHGCLTEQQVIRMGIDLCCALEICEKHGILHRDIKPGNIFLNRNGDFKLGDFGIAKTIEETTSMSQKGTLAYMAPEIFTMSRYGFTVDLYSLGMVLYQYLNENRTPFLPLPPISIVPSMREEARIRRIRGEAIPEPANGSQALKQVILKAVSFAPEDRYQSATEFRKALEAVASQQTPEPSSLPQITDVELSYGNRNIRLDGDEISWWNRDLPGKIHYGHPRVSEYLAHQSRRLSREESSRLLCEIHRIPLYNLSPADENATVQGDRLVCTYSDGTVLWYSSAQKPPEITEVYRALAKWCTFVPDSIFSQPVKYEVTFYNDRGQVIQKGDYPEGAFVQAPAVPARYRKGRDRYRFTGWSPEIQATVTQKAQYTAVYQKQKQRPIDPSRLLSVVLVLAIVAGLAVLLFFPWRGEPEAVTLGQDSATLVVGETAELTASVQMTKGEFSGSISWSSSDLDVAIVEKKGSASAEVTCIGAGTCVITATAGDCEGELELTCVKDAVLTLDTETVSGMIGDTVDLEATVTISDEEYSGTVKWETSDESVATVVSTGPTTAEVSLVGEGVAAISATAGMSGAYCQLSCVESYDAFLGQFVTETLIPAEGVQSSSLLYTVANGVVEISQGTGGVLSTLQADFDGDGSEELLVVHTTAGADGYLGYLLDLYRATADGVSQAAVTADGTRLNSTGTTAVLCFDRWLCVASYEAGTDSETSVHIFDLGNDLLETAGYQYSRTLNRVKITNLVTGEVLCDMSESSYWDGSVYETMLDQISGQVAASVGDETCAAFTAEYIVKSIWGENVADDCSDALLAESSFVGTTVSGVVSVTDHTGIQSAYDDSEPLSYEASFPSGTVSYNDHHYCVFTDEIDWATAEASCEAMGGHLVTIGDSDENEFVYELICTYSTEIAFLMGGTDSETEGEFVWITGEPFLYTNWGYLNEPDNYRGYKDQDCITMLPFDQSGTYKDDSGEQWGVYASQWDDKDGGSNPYVCEWDY